MVSLASKVLEHAVLLLPTSSRKARMPSLVVSRFWRAERQKDADLASSLVMLEASL